MQTNNGKENSANAGHNLKHNKTIKTPKQEVNRAIYETQDVYRNAFTESPRS